MFVFLWLLSLVLSFSASAFDLQTGYQFQLTDLREHDLRYAVMRVLYLRAFEFTCHVERTRLSPVHSLAGQRLMLSAAAPYNEMKFYTNQKVCFTTVRLFV